MEFGARLPARQFQAFQHPASRKAASLLATQRLTVATPATG
jgi:hypothetical protein